MIHQTPAIPQKGSTRVLYKFNTPDYVELKFDHWTPSFLVVKYPYSGKPWRMSRQLVDKWTASGVLKIEGFIPARS